MPYRTLGELRAEILARLGMGAMGASGGANLSLINSFLRNGQSQLYRLQDWRQLTDYEDKTTGIGQNLYDYPTSGVMTSGTAARDKRIVRLEVDYSGQWTELREGITTDMWSTMETRSVPARYERYAQILVYPRSDAAYTLRFWFVSDLGRFTEENDRCTLDDELVLLHALANAKAHYRHPDAATYQGQLDSLLGGLRGQSFGSNRVYRRDYDGLVERKPAVVGRNI